MGNACPQCGGEYTRLAMHWNRSSCSYHPFTDEQMEILTGILMGDGDIHGMEDPNPHFRVRMTNKPFLEHLSKKLGLLSKGVFLDRSAKEQYQTAMANKKTGMEKFQVVNKENYNDLFGLRTCSHPDLSSFKDWYKTGEKRFPNDIVLTPMVTKMWYVCDGWLATENGRSRLMFKVSNESDRPQFLINLFKEVGFDVNHSRQAIQVPTEESYRMLEWMGDSPPGFNYKWAS